MEAQQPAPSTGLPRVSLVVPVFNEAAHLPGLFDALERQTYPAGLLDVVIADGCSTDTTRAVAEQRAGRSPLRVQVVDNPARRTPAGLNAGIAAAHGDLVMIVGGHSAPEPTFVERSVNALLAHDATAAGGQVETVGSGRWGSAIATAMRSPFGVGGNAMRSGRPHAGPADTVPFAVYRREVFDTLGGFDEAMVGAEDAEFNTRVRRHGGTLWFDPAIRSTYVGRGDLGALARQCHVYGRGKAWIARRHRFVPAPRQLVPPAFVAALGAGVLVAAGTTGPRRAVGAAPAVLYSFVALAAARRTARRGDALRVAAAFATMHVSYGAGFLRGAVRRPPSPRIPAMAPGAPVGVDAARR